MVAEVTAYHDATLKTAKHRDGGALKYVRRYKCPRCKQVRGTRCGFDAKKRRFHMMNWGCQTLEALKLALPEVGREVLPRDRAGYFVYYQVKLDDITALGEWKIEHDKFLLAVEVEKGELVPMRLSTANKIIAAAERQMAGRYEGEELPEDFETAVPEPGFDAEVDP